MGKGAIISLAGLLLMLSGGKGTAQVSFLASLSRNPVGEQENFEVRFTVSNGNPTAFVPPSFEHFQLLSGRNQSTSMSIVNGKVTQEMTFSYHLRPKGKGTFTIGAARITVDGKSHKSEPIEVIVEARTGGAQGSGQQQGFDQIFLRGSVDRRRVFVGEQVVYSLRLYFYFRISMDDYSLQASTFDGFWKESLKSAGRNVKQERINGVLYNYVDVAGFALFPQHAGQLTIASQSLEAIVGTSIFNRQRIRVASNPIMLDVIPLPEQNKPGSFRGAVGEFHLRAEISDTVLSTDDALTFRMHVSGNGNPRLISPPDLGLPGDLEVYEPRIKESVSNVGKISGTKSFEFLIIPRHPGRFKLEPIAFTFFDPRREAYMTLRTPAYGLNIRKGTGGSGISASGLSKEEVELLGEDIRFIKTGGLRLHKIIDPMLLSWRFYGLYLAPFVLLIPLLLYRRRRDHLASDLVLARSRAAYRQGVRRIRAAAKKHFRKDMLSYHDEIGKGLWGYLNARLNIPMAEMNKARAFEMLSGAGAGELTGPLDRALDQCSLSLYSPASGSEEGQPLHEVAEGLLGRLERALER